MAGYIKKWTCRVCLTPVESIDTPFHHVCSECIAPTATKILQETYANAQLGDPGIDSRYWMMRAEAAITLLMRRWAAH